MYEEIQNNLSWEINETDGIVDESNWTKVASSSFLKALKNSAKCVCLGDSFINIDLTFNDEPSTAYSKNNSLTTKVNNSCYKSFVEHKKYFDSNIYYHHVTFYDNSNNELGYFMHNIFGNLSTD